MRTTVSPRSANDAIAARSALSRSTLRHSADWSVLGPGVITDAETCSQPAPLRWRSAISMVAEPLLMRQARSHSG